MAHLLFALLIHHLIAFRTPLVNKDPLMPTKEVLRMRGEARLVG